jgi:hypothetical protein
LFFCFYSEYFQIVDGWSANVSIPCGDVNSNSATLSCLRLLVYSLNECCVFSGFFFFCCNEYFQIVDGWSANVSIPYGDVNLNNATLYQVRLLYRSGVGNSSIQWLWSSFSIPFVRLQTTNTTNICDGFGGFMCCVRFRQARCSQAQQTLIGI